MRTAILLCAIWLSVLSAAPEPEKKAAEPAPMPALSLDGVWRCAGGVGDYKYTGYCVIAKAGQGWKVSWVIEGGEVMTGTGHRDGDFFFVGWSLGAASGLSRFKVEELDPPKMKGWWMIAAKGTPKVEETLTFLGK